MFSEIIGKLKIIIQGVAGVQLVYDYEPNKPTQYPYATLTPLGHSKSQYETLRDASREVRIMMRVYGHLHETQQSGQTNLRTVVDSLIDSLESQENATLDGTIDYAELTESNFRFVNKESQLYVCEITYYARRRYNRY